MEAKKYLIYLLFQLKQSVSRSWVCQLVNSSDNFHKSEMLQFSTTSYNSRPNDDDEVFKDIFLLCEWNSRFVRMQLLESGHSMAYCGIYVWHGMPYYTILYMLVAFALRSRKWLTSFWSLLQLSLCAFARHAHAHTSDFYDGSHRSRRIMSCHNNRQKPPTGSAPGSDGNCSGHGTATATSTLQITFTLSHLHFHTLSDDDDDVSPKGSPQPARERSIWRGVREEEVCRW